MVLPLGYEYGYSLVARLMGSANSCVPTTSMGHIAGLKSTMKNGSPPSSSCMSLKM